MTHRRAGRTCCCTDSTAWLDGRGAVFFKDVAYRSTDPAARARGGRTPRPDLRAAQQAGLQAHDLPRLRRRRGQRHPMARESPPRSRRSSRPGTRRATGRRSTTPSCTSIQAIWASVAEDYAPFDVDVTTADPGRRGDQPGQRERRRLRLPRPDHARARAPARPSATTAAAGSPTSTRSAPPTAAPAATATATSSPPGSSRSCSAELPQEHRRGRLPRGRPQARPPARRQRRSSPATTRATAPGRRSWAWATSARSASGARATTRAPTTSEDDVAIAQGCARRALRRSPAAASRRRRASPTADEVHHQPHRRRRLPARHVQRHLLGVGERRSTPWPTSTSSSPSSPPRGPPLATADPRLGTDQHHRRDRDGRLDHPAEAAGTYYVAVDGTGNGRLSTGYDDYGSMGAYTMSKTGNCNGAFPDRGPVEGQQPERHRRPARRRTSR